MRIGVHFLLGALTVLLASCAITEKGKTTFSVFFHVADERVVIERVDSAFKPGSVEYEAALYWYQRAFNNALLNARSHEKTIEVLHFSKDRKGRAAEVGSIHGDIDAIQYLEKRANQALQPTSTSVTSRAGARAAPAALVADL